MIPKFRAWDGSSLSRMYSPLEVMVGDSDIWIFDEDSEGNEWIVNNDLSLMQSTGLTDKNGKEIFEGDILEVNDWLEVVSFSEEKAMFVSKGIGFPETSLYDLLDSDIFTVEIIGNIYTNPKLAEVEQ